MLLLIGLLAVANVSAADNLTDDFTLTNFNQNDVTQVNDNEIINSNNDSSAGTISDLANDIEESTNQLNLTKDYIYSNDQDSDYVGGIRINKQITIDGKGFAINGNNQSKLFWITANNVVLKNIHFKDFKSSNGGAIVWDRNNGLLDNCTFTNCISESSSWGGGAVRFQCDGTISNCHFENCQAMNHYGGAIHWPSNDGNLYNCTFINCLARMGSAIYSSGTNTQIHNCTFVNSSTDSNGHTIYASGKSNKIYDCKFLKCSLSIKVSGNNVTVFNSTFKDGGNINWGGSDGLLENCQFTNADKGYVSWSAINGIMRNCNFVGGMGGFSWEGNNGTLFNTTFKNTGRIYWSGNDALILNSTFINTYGDGHGGALNFAGNNNTIVNSTFRNTAARLYGGAIYTKNTNYFLYCEFDSCSANSGSAIYWDSSNGNAFKCSFLNCENAQKESTPKEYGTFEELEKLIKYINPYDTFDLTMNYKSSNFNPYGVTITKPITINGNGHIIDCEKSSRSFIIIENNVLIKNIIFQNGYFDGDGGSIYVDANNTILSQCTFKNNYATNDGGALYVNKNTNHNTINNCIFTTNTISTKNNAIYGLGSNSQINNSQFIDNNILWNAPNGIVSNSSFKESLIDTDENDYYPKCINCIGLKKETSITISTNCYNYMEAYLKDEDKNPVKNMVITFKFDNSNDLQTLKTDNDGCIVISTNFAIGTTHNIYLQFDSNRRYEGYNKSFSFVVGSSILFYESNGVYNSEGMVFPLTYLYKTGKIWSLRNFTATFGTKNYTFTNPYTHEELVKELTIVPRISENKDLTMPYSDLIDYTVRVATKTGKFVENQIVKFNVDNNNYYVKTDKNGYATLKVHLVAEKYTITTKIDDVEVSNQLVINPVLVTNNYKDIYIKSVTAYYSQDKDIDFGWKGYFKGYLKIYKGKTLVISEEIDNSEYIGDYMKYPVYSDCEYAEVLPSTGTYQAKIVDLSGKVVAQSTIKITKTPTTIKVPSVTVKSGKKVTITAMVYEKSCGDAHWGGKVTFKINGKTYNLKIKEGVAKIKIKLPSKIKTYSCKAKFLGDKNAKSSSTKFKIIVKKKITAKKKTTTKKKSVTITVPTQLNMKFTKSSGKYTVKSYKWIEYYNGKHAHIDIRVYKNGKKMTDFNAKFYVHYNGGGGIHFTYHPYYYEYNGIKYYKALDIGYNNALKADKIKVTIMV